MKDQGWRVPLKKLALFRFQFDLAATRFWLRLRGEGPSYRLEGTCNGCGACCIRPTIAVGRLTFHIGFLRKLFLAWHFHVNGFEYMCEDAELRTFSFRCTHYDRETQTCDSYETRPGMCRDYPKNLTYDPNPDLFDECSYKVVYKGADAMKEALAKTELTPEQQEEIARKLHL